MILGLEIVDGFFKAVAHLDFVNKDIVRLSRLIRPFCIFVQLVILKQWLIFAQTVIDVDDVGISIRLPDIFHKRFQQL